MIEKNLQLEIRYARKAAAAYFSKHYIKYLYYNAMSKHYEKKHIKTIMSRQLSRLEQFDYFYELLAQQVEHKTFNFGVQGSIPWQLTKEE